MGDLTQNLVSSLTGNTEKAYIIIKDDREIPDNVEVKSNENTGKKLNIPGTGSITEAAGELKKKMEEGTANVSSDKKFIVRFNPSSLNVQATGGGRYAKSNYSDKGSDMEYAPLSSRIQMSVKLLFDESDTKLMSSKTDSVLKYTEGFVAALRNPLTRKVEFHWNKMTYAGILNMVDVEYTMFSIYGEPLRAEVNIGLLCVDEEIGQNDMGYWHNAYKTVFGSGAETILTGKLQNVAGIFNVNL